MQSLRSVFVKVLKELVEDVIEQEEIDPGRRVLPVDAGNVVVQTLADVFQLLFVLPDPFEQLRNCSVWGLAVPGDELGRIAGLVAGPRR